MILMCRDTHGLLLQHRFISKSSWSIDQRISRRANVLFATGYLFARFDENFLERFAELTRHPAVDCKIDWIANDEEKVRKQDEQVRYVVVEELINKRGDDV